MTRALVALALLALAAPLPAAAHEPGAPTFSGYVATVSGIRPNVIGLQARGVLGDQIVVSNRTRRPVVILDPEGRPLMRIAAGKSRSWHDVRVVARGDPPPHSEGAGEQAARFVKNWRIPGRSGARTFLIEGFLGWVPPQDDPEDGVSPSLLVAAAAALLALSAVAAFLLGRRTRDQTSPTR